MAPSCLVSKFPLHQADRGREAPLLSFLDTALMGNSATIVKDHVEIGMPGGERQATIQSFNSHSVISGLPGRLTFCPDPDQPSLKDDQLPSKGRLYQCIAATLGGPASMQYMSGAQLEKRSTNLDGTENITFSKSYKWKGEEIKSSISVDNRERVEPNSGLNTAISWFEKPRNLLTDYRTIQTGPPIEYKFQNKTPEDFRRAHAASPPSSVATSASARSEPHLNSTQPSNGTISRRNYGWRPLSGADSTQSNAHTTAPTQTHPSTELSQAQDNLSNTAPTVAQPDSPIEAPAPTTAHTIASAKSVKTRMSMNFLCD